MDIEIKPLIRKLFTHDGGKQTFCSALSIQQVKAKLQTNSLRAHVLPDGVHVCFVDEYDKIKDLPENPEASALVKEKIRGDAYIAPSRDFTSY